MKLNLLDKYIAKNILSAIALVTLMLAGLQIFILFVNQIDDLGKINYGLLEAALYVFLQTPYQMYLFMPMASLLGALIGLGVMANHHELVVMRAQGMSIGQVIGAVLKASMLVIILATFIGETFVPKLAQLANTKKFQALHEGQALQTQKGIWLRYKNDFIAIEKVLDDKSLEKVNQFHFDDNHHLVFARSSNLISWKDGFWTATDVAESYIENNNVTTKHYAKIPWDVALEPNVMRVSSSEPDEMTLPELHNYINTQPTALNYKISYWQRLIQPITTAVMMILAIPFIFGPLRSSTMGSKLLVGATIGFGFHILNRVFGTISQVLQWPPLIGAITPTILFTALGLYLLMRRE